MEKEPFVLGRKYKSHSLSDLEKVGNYDIFEAVLDKDNELSFYNHTDKAIYDLNFLGNSELVRLPDIRFMLLTKKKEEQWSMYSQQIEQIKANGLPVYQEVSGDTLLMDKDFLLFLEQEQEEATLNLLIGLSFYNLKDAGGDSILDSLDSVSNSEEPSENEKQVKVIKKVVEKNSKSFLITLNDGLLIEHIQSFNVSPPVVEEEGMANEVLLERLQRWQRKPLFHELTCRIDSRHALLEPIEEEGQVILLCPDCKHKQTGIPKIFFSDDFDRLYEEQKNLLDLINQVTK